MGMKKEKASKKVNIKSLIFGIIVITILLGFVGTFGFVYYRDNVINKNNKEVIEKTPTKEVVANYLTFTAKEADSTIVFNWTSGENVQITTNGTTWVDYNMGETITLSHIDSFVKFRAINIKTSYESLGSIRQHFIMTGKIAASGSVTSLTDGVGGDSSVQLQDFCYEAMFYRCLSLIQAPELPATNLSEGCYSSMFAGCTSLKSLPALKATTLTKDCYSYMFNGCTSIDYISDNYLPSTSLAENCYASMFYGCTKLTSLPKNLLPATTLAKNCYKSMFSNCSSIKYIPYLKATELADGCYETMFYACKALKLVEVTSGEDIYIPSDAFDVKFGSSMVGQINGDSPIQTLSLGHKYKSVAHDHEWHFILEQNTIKAYCAERTDTVLCEHQGSQTDFSHAVIVTLVGPTEMFYTGSSIECHLDNLEEWTATGFVAPSISYQYRPGVFFDFVETSNTVNAGIYKAIVTYGDYSLTKEFEIKKAEGAATLSMEDWTYFATASIPQVTSETNGVNNITYYYKLTSDPDSQYTTEKPTNVGEYTLKAVFAESSNYKEVTQTCTFKIVKAELSPTISFSDYAYGGTIPVPAIISSVGDVAAKYYINKKGDTTKYNFDDIKSNSFDCGVYEISAVIPETNNYDAYVVDALEFTITKGKAVEPTVKGTYIFNGTARTVEFENFESYMTIIGGTDTAANAGTYTVIFDLEENYEWKSGHDGVVEWTIEKAKVTEPKITQAYYVYTGEPITAEFEGFVAEYMSIEDSITETAIGLYATHFTLNSNYQWVDGSDGVVEWEISKQKVAEPTIKGIYTYNGEFLEYELEGYDATFMYKIHSPLGKTAGTYYIQIGLDDDHVWDENSDGMIEWVISKKTVVEPTVEGTYTYTGELQKVVFSNFYETYMTIDGVGNAAKNAGTYTVHITLDDNYKWAYGNDGYVEWTIEKLKVEQPIVHGSYVYNGSVQTVQFDGLQSYMTISSGNTGINAGTYTAIVTLDSNHTWDSNSTGTISWKIEKKEVAEPTINSIYTYTGQVITAEVDGFESYMTITGNKEKNAGTHSAMVFLDSNHKWDENSDGLLEWTIKKAIASKPSVSGPYSYNGSEQTVLLNGLEDYMKLSGTLSAIDVGTYSFTVTLNSNYQWNDDFDGNLVWTINKMKVAEPTVLGNYIYDGTQKRVDLNGVENYMSTKSLLTGMNAGWYTVVYTLDDNHEWDNNSDGIVEWEIRYREIDVISDGSIIVSAANGFPTNVVLNPVVTEQSEVRTKINNQQLNINYYNLNKKYKLRSGEEISFIYEVEMYVLVDGSRIIADLQDVDGVDKIKVKIKLPQELKTSSVSRVLIVNRSKEVTELDFNIFSVDRYGYFEVELDHISEIAFVVDKDCNYHWFLIGILAIFVVTVLISYNVLKHRKFTKVSITVTVIFFVSSITFAVLGIIHSMCSWCITFLLINLIYGTMNSFFYIFNDLPERFSKLTKEFFESLKNYKGTKTQPEDLNNTSIDSNETNREEESVENTDILDDESKDE